jgi:hypothetical protein
LIAFGRVLRISVYDYFVTPRAPEKKHSFHFVKLEFVLVFLPEGIAVLAYCIADFTKEEIASDG